MHKYKGKAKCSCGKRAKYRVMQRSGNLFACEQHKHKIVDKEDICDIIVDEDYSEADYQTWLRV